MPNFIKKSKDPVRARQQWNEQKTRYYRKTANAINHGKAWTSDEDKIVAEHKFTDRQISDMIGRSMEAIQIRRSRLKKMV